MNSVSAQRTGVDHVVIVVASFYPDVFGGAERQAMILAQSFGDQGARVTLLAPTLGQSSEEETDFGQIVRFKLRHLPYFGGRRIGSTLAWTLKVLNWARANPDPIDVVYVMHGRLHAAAAAVLARRARAPLFVKPGGAGPSFDLELLRRKRGGYGRVLAGHLARTASFIANSEAIAADLRSWSVGEDRIFRVSNGAVVPESMDVADWSRRRGGQSFAFSGRIDHEKDVLLLLEAFAALHRRRPQARLTYIGSGPAEGELRSRAAALGLDEAVTFRGRVSEVYAELARHDYYVSASIREGQSNALLEAMACGCIPVVSNASGVADVVAPGETGFIVTQQDAQAFVAQMEAALDLSAAERARMSRANHEFAKANFSLGSVASRTLEIFGRTRAHRSSGASA